MLTEENEQQALSLAERDQENEDLQKKNQEMMELLSILNKRLEAVACTTPASSRRVHITEPDKGSNLAGDGKPRSSSRHRPSPKLKSSVASNDGDPANTEAASIGEHG